MRNKSRRPSFDSFVRILIFKFRTVRDFALPFAHAPPTAALFPVASPSYSELSSGVKTKTRAVLPFRRYKCPEIGALLYY